MLRSTMRANCEWRTPPAGLTLADDEVHIWHTGLDLPEAFVYDLEQILSEDELDRARRFHFPKDRRHFTVAHGRLRAILGLYLDAPPSHIGFRYNRYGKPSLAESAIYFNLSHSGGRALYAFTRRAEIGVDIERIRTDVEYAQIAEKFFSPRENAALRTLYAHQQPLAFFNCWTRKEAFIKAIGEGVSFPLDQFDVSLVPGEPARLLTIRGDARVAAGWQLEELDVGDGYAAAYAMQSTGCQLKCWQWHEEAEG